VRENLQQIVFMTQRDPAAIAGFLLLGSAGVLSFGIQLRMVRAGYQTSLAVIGNPWGTVGDYMSVRTKHDWSPWPVYLLGPLIILGVCLLALGLFRLQK
jgi:hypothetical protein